MPSAITSTLLLSSKPIFLFKDPFFFSPSTCPNGPISPLLKPLSLKCSGNSEEQETSNGLKEALSGILGKQVEELLNKEENKGLLDGLEKASQRVEIAKRQLAEIEKRELESQLLRNYIEKLESRASEIAETQQEISEARAMIDEAEQSLSPDEDNVGDGMVSAAKHYSAAAPFISQFHQLCIVRVTFRYAVRRDLDNFQLKTGTCAAFGFVKGLGTLGGGAPLELDAQSFLSHAVDGALYVSQNLFIFLFAAVGLDFCIKTRILSPFPMKRSTPRTDAR
ncbi:transcription factor MYB86 [Hibiscus syriacus]|uniref:Transcription factor MYB86 n=1 Tax=Hibiscus syriacus TaxID=106335 RepID=A0A6A3CJ63_HIBSY|nr:transcription factor MYB86 [Hibiscus syriacus]